MFADLLPGANVAPTASGNVFADLMPKPTPDHSNDLVHHEGLLDNLMAPITDFGVYGERIEAKRRAELKESLSRMLTGDTTWDKMKGGGMTALNALNYVWTPVTAAERSVVSAPLESAFGIPHEYTELALDTAIPFAGEMTIGKQAMSTIRAAANGLSHNAIVEPLIDAIAPASKAENVAGYLREAGGELAYRRERAQELFSHYRKFFDNQSAQDNVQFIIKHERGLTHDNPVLGQASHVISTVFDSLVDEVRSFGEGHLESVLENYFPHMWKDGKKAANLSQELMSKGPLLGSKSFLHERIYRYVTEGLNAGLKLKYDNPIDAVTAKIHEMNRYIVNKRMIDTLKDQGYLKFFGDGKIPQGWVTINDPVARVRQYSETEGGFINRGNYAAPENAARIINNMLGRSKLADNPVFNAVRAASNALNMTQLGLSAFHLGFTTVDAVTSQVALGIKQLARGDLEAGLKSIATSPAAPVQTFMRGHKLMDEYLRGSGRGDLVSAVVQGGGRVRMPRDFASSAQGSFMSSLKEGTLFKQVANSFKDHGLFGGAYHNALRVAETSSAWMMEGLVPRMKLGVFANMAEDTLRRNPNMSPLQLRDMFQKHWASVDNRMGEMVYDNLFWNKTGKDIAHLAVRSVGWNLGTFRELGGGVADGAKLIDAIARGDKAAFTDRLAYTIALPVTTATMGAMMNYALTGEGPKELKDYFFPRTGGTTKYGTPERLSLPSYMKDVYEYGHDAGSTLVNKTNPMVPIVHQMLTNKDFYGAPIVDPNETDPAEIMAQYIRYVGKSAMPFSIQGAIHAADEDEKMKAYLSFIGLTSAPGYITSPDEIAAKQHERDVKDYERRQRMTQ